MKQFISAVLMILCSAISSTAAEPLKIGISLGLTGRHAEISGLQAKSFRLWERDVNSKGGIIGRKVKLLIYDNKSNPETARQDVVRLINTDRVDLLFPPYSSELTEAILPTTEKAGFPIIASGASGDRLWDQGYKGFFGLYSLASKYVTGFLEMLTRENFKNAAVIYADDSFSIGIANGTRQWANNFGISVPVFQGFKKGTKDFDPIVSALKASKPEIVILCAYFNESVEMRQAFKRAGWYPKIYYASVGPALPAYYSKLGPSANYTFTSSQWEQHGKLPGSREFYASFVKTYGIEPSYHAANAYAAGQILEKAIIRAKSFDKEKLREILSSMSTMTIIGRYGVDRAGRQIKHFPIVLQWQKGKKEIVWPKNLRTADPIFRKGGVAP